MRGCAGGRCECWGVIQNCSRDLLRFTRVKRRRATLYAQEQKPAGNFLQRSEKRTGKGRSWNAGNRLEIGGGGSFRNFGYCRAFVGNRRAAETSSNADSDGRDHAGAGPGAEQGSLRGGQLASCS